MSTLKVATIQDTSGNNSSTPSQVAEGRAKVWVSFSGSGTPSINDDFNVSSITDNATGQFTVNFTSAMANNDYACLITTQAGLSAYGFGTGNNTINTGNVKVFCITHSGGTQDVSHCSVAIFGD